MPKIPTIQRHFTKERALQGGQITTRTSEETYGGGSIADEFKGAQDAISTEFMKVKKRMDDTRIQEASNDAFALKTELMAEMQSQKGKNAVGYHEVIDQKWRDGLAHIEGNLTGSIQKRSFIDDTNRKSLNLNKSVNEYQAAQAKIYEDSVYTNANANSLEESVQNYQQIIETTKDEATGVTSNKLITPGRLPSGESRPSQVESAIDSMVKRIKLRSVNLGWSEEEEGREIRYQTSKVHTAIITRMTDNNHEDVGKEYFKKYQKDVIGPATDPEMHYGNKGKKKIVRYGMTAKDIHDMEVHTELGADRKFYQDATDKIMAMKDKNGHPLGMQAAKAYARKNHSGKARDEVVRRLDVRHRDLRASKKIDEENRYDAASNWVDKSQGPGGHYVLPSHYKNLSSKHKDAIDARVKRLNQGDEGTDTKLVYELETLASSPATMKEFANTYLPEIEHRIPKADYKRLKDLQMSVRKSLNKEVDKLIGDFQSSKLILDRHIKANLGIKDLSPAKLKGDDLKTVMDFTKEYHRIKAKEIKRKGKDLSNAEEQEILGHMTRDFYTTSTLGFRHGGKKLYQLKDGDKVLGVEYKDIPDGTKEGIKADMRTYNDLIERKVIQDTPKDPDNEDQVLELYLKKLRKFKKDNK